MLSLYRSLDIGSIRNKQKKPCNYIKDLSLMLMPPVSYYSVWQFQQIIHKNRPWWPYVCPIRKNSKLCKRDCIDALYYFSIWQRSFRKSQTTIIIGKLCRVLTLILHMSYLFIYLTKQFPVRLFNVTAKQIRIVFSDLDLSCQDEIRKPLIRSYIVAPHKYYSILPS